MRKQIVAKKVLVSSFFLDLCKVRNAFWKLLHSWNTLEEGNTIFWALVLSFSWSILFFFFELFRVVPETQLICHFISPIFKWKEVIWNNILCTNCEIQIPLLNFNIPCCRWRSAFLNDLLQKKRKKWRNLQFHIRQRKRATNCKKNSKERKNLEF